MLAAFERELDLGIPLFGDPGRAAYGALGFGRGSVRRVWLDPRVWAAYARLLGRGRRPGLNDQDKLQLGGDAVIDAAGVLRWIYRSDGTRRSALGGRRRRPAARGGGMSTARVIDEHRAAGRELTAAGVRSFVREQGDGEPVVCLHGVPASSFLYRKVLRELAGRGLRGIAWDLPGLGLAERPQAFDYSWTGLGRFCHAAIVELGLERFHLVVHDVGGPVGFELAAAVPERVASLTVLNTIVEVDTFKRPWSMEPFARRGVGELYLRTLTKPAFRTLMRLQGVADMSAVSRDELGAYVDLLRRDDGGAAFLRIMRGFERTERKRALYASVLRDVPYPVQIVWGERDPALKLAVHGEQARRAAGLDTIHRLPAKHFLQEDQAPAIADRVAAIAAG